MSESFQRWFQRFVRWFFNSSPTALLDDEAGTRAPRRSHVESDRTRSPRSRRQLTRIDAR